MVASSPGKRERERESRWYAELMLERPSCCACRVLVPLPGDRLGSACTLLMSCSCVARTPRCARNALLRVAAVVVRGYEHDRRARAPALVRCQRLVSPTHRYRGMSVYRRGLRVAIGVACSRDERTCVRPRWWLLGQPQRSADQGSGLWGAHFFRSPWVGRGHRHGTGLSCSLVFLGRTEPRASPSPRAPCGVRVGKSHLESVTWTIQYGMVW